MVKPIEIEQLITMELKSLSSTDLCAVFGTTETPSKPMVFHRGSFAITVSDGQITAIHWNDQEIARGINYLVRDRNWGSCSAASNRSETSEKIVLSGKVIQQDILFDHAMEITLQGKDTLLIRSRGKALSDFQSNRVGLTLLHPVPDTVGLPLQIRHMDKSETATFFPKRIQPSQPATGIAGLSYPLRNEAHVHMGFEATKPNGDEDCFEMEDQRNWGDASYKTYIGSLLDPWPFQVLSGDVFEQSIKIAVKMVSRTAAVRKSCEVVSGKAFRLPKLGASIPLARANEALENIKTEGVPPVAFVSAYLRGDALDQPELHSIRKIVDRLNCPLRVELEYHDGASIEESAQVLRDAGLTVAQILACPAAYLKSYQPDAIWPDVEPLDAFYNRVRDAFPNAEIGGGMLTYFTELNRKWPPLEAIDFIGHAYCPIIHAADDLTVLQNVSTLPLIAQTIAEKAPGLPYDLISANLSMRSNPYGEAPLPNPDLNRVAMAQADPRENGEFAGQWMLEIGRAMGQTHARSYCVGALAGPASIYANGHKRPSFAAFEMLAMNVGVGQEALDAEVAALRDSVYRRSQAALDL